MVSHAAFIELSNRVESLFQSQEDERRRRVELARSVEEFRRSFNELKEAIEGIAGCLSTPITPLCSAEARDTSIGNETETSNPDYAESEFLMNDDDVLVHEAFEKDDDVLKHDEKRAPMGTITESNVGKRSAGLVAHQVFGEMLESVEVRFLRSATSLLLDESEFAHKHVLLYDFSSPMDHLREMCFDPGGTLIYMVDPLKLKFFPPKMGLNMRYIEEELTGMMNLFRVDLARMGLDQRKPHGLLNGFCDSMGYMTIVCFDPGGQLLICGMIELFVAMGKTYLSFGAFARCALILWPQLRLEHYFERAKSLVFNPGIADFIFSDHASYLLNDVCYVYLMSAPLLFMPRTFASWSSLLVSGGIINRLKLATAGVTYVHVDFVMGCIRKYIQAVDHGARVSYFHAYMAAIVGMLCVQLAVLVYRKAWQKDQFRCSLSLNAKTAHVSSLNAACVFGLVKESMIILVDHRPCPKFADVDMCLGKKFQLKERLCFYMGYYGERGKVCCYIRFCELVMNSPTRILHAASLNLVNRCCLLYISNSGKEDLRGKEIRGGLLVEYLYCKSALLKLQVHPQVFINECILKFSSMEQNF